MNELTTVLASETELPMAAVGWGLLVLALVVTLAWLVYLYR